MWEGAAYRQGTCVRWEVCGVEGAPAGVHLGGLHMGGCSTAPAHDGCSRAGKDRGRTGAGLFWASERGCTGERGCLEQSLDREAGAGSGDSCEGRAWAKRRGRGVQSG